MYNDVETTHPVADEITQYIKNTLMFYHNDDL